MAFINPYTFIRFPSKVCREPHPGHAPSREEAKNRYTGTLTVRWEIQTPLAIPSDGSWGLGGKREIPDSRNRRADLTGEITVPGASVKGAVRSLHEALFAGCARIVDSHYTPVYREAITNKLLDGWQLAVVISSDANVMAKGPDPRVMVMLCDTPVQWVRGSAVARAANGLPRTGDFIKPAEPVINGRPNGFRGVNQYVSVPRGPGSGTAQAMIGAVRQGLSTILVTDTAARAADQPYYWAAARPNPNNRRRVSVAALTRLRKKLRYADKVAEPDETTDQFEPVVWPPNGETPVAQRRTIDGYLRQGDVIWVRAPGDEVIDVKLSLGWRRPAGGKHPTLAARIPTTVEPCRHLSTGLCLSCAIFGSVDAVAAERREGAQDGYAGHVRFGDITGTCTAGRSTVTLAPLGTPHPSAGMFYLEPVTSKQLEDVMESGDFPSHWDSKAAEHPRKRDLRGRKFYWHSDPQKQRQARMLPQERFRAVDGVHDNPDLLPCVHLVEKADLTQQITFDGLDATALASLLATLNPELVLGEGNFALHLGRGKPLGLGSVRAAVHLDMTTTADRYADNPTRHTQLPEMDAIFRDKIPVRCGPGLTDIHKEARKVLDLDGLGARAIDVSYPTLESWTAFATEAFHNSYAYFQENAGEVRRPKDKPPYREPWAPMPMVLEEGK